MTKKRCFLERQTFDKPHLRAEMLLKFYKSHFSPVLNHWLLHVGPPWWGVEVGGGGGDERPNTHNYECVARALRGRVGGLTALVLPEEPLQQVTLLFAIISCCFFLIGHSLGLAYTQLFDFHRS